MDHGEHDFSALSEDQAPLDHWQQRPRGNTESKGWPNAYREALMRLTSENLLLCNRARLHTRRTDRELAIRARPEHRKHGPKPTKRSRTFSQSIYFSAALARLRSSVSVESTPPYQVRDLNTDATRADVARRETIRMAIAPNAKGTLEASVPLSHQNPTLIDPCSRNACP